MRPEEILDARIWFSFAVNQQSEGYQASLFLDSAVLRSLAALQELSPSGISIWSQWSDVSALPAILSCVSLGSATGSFQFCHPSSLPLIFFPP